ncbi:MAG: hypothetical protein R3C19_08800 [Planctomycetaceae bacterium]
MPNANIREAVSSVERTQPPLAKQALAAQRRPDVRWQPASVRRGE